MKVTFVIEVDEEETDVNMLLESIEAEVEGHDAEIVSYTVAQK